MRLKIAIAVLFAGLLVSAFAEEKDNNEVFINAAPEKAIRLLESLRASIRAHDFSAAATACQSLLSAYRRTLIPADRNNYAPLEETVVTEFMSLGPEGIRAFRDQYDPPAAKLREGYISGDLTQAEALAWAFPFSSYAPDALERLASFHANAGRFKLAAYLLETAFSRFPAEVPDKVGAFALLARCYRGTEDSASLSAMVERLAKLGLTDAEFAGGKLSSFIGKLASEVPPPDLSERPYPCGAPSGFGSQKTSVRHPTLLWSAPVAPRPVAPGTAVEEEYVPFLNAENSRDLVSLRPIVVSGRIFCSDGSAIYSRDMENGFYLHRYPVGSNMEQSYGPPVGDFAEALSASAFRGALYCNQYARNTNAFSTPIQIGAYRIEGADALFEDISVRFDSGNDAQAAKVLAGMSFVSVPLALPGQVFLVGIYTGGIGDAWGISIDPGTGKIQWMTQLFSFAVTGAAARLSVSVIPAYSNGRLFVCYNGVACSLNAADGSPLWVTTYPTITPNFPVEPPVIAGDCDVAILSPCDSAKVLGLSCNTGRVLWSADRASLRAFIGLRGNEAFFKGNGDVVALRFSDGQVVRRLPVKERVAGVGAISGDDLILPVVNGLIFISSIDGAVKTRFNLGGMSNVYLGRVIPLSDRIICATPEAVYCFVDSEAFRALIESRRLKNPDDPIPDFLLATNAMNSGDGPAALELFKAAFDKGGEGASYFGYKLRDWIHSRMAVCYRRLADSEAGKNPARMMELIEKALSVVIHPSERVYLQQLRIEAALKLKNYDVAMTVLIDLASEQPNESVVAEDRLISILGAELGYKGGQPSDSLRRLCLDCLDFVAASTPDRIAPFIAAGDELAAKALAGDVKAAARVMAGFFFTAASAKVASFYSISIIEGRNLPGSETVVLDDSKFYPIPRCPELLVARAVLLKARSPAMAENLALAALEFPDRKIVVGGREELLSDIVFGAFPMLAAPARSTKKTDFKQGLAKVWEQTIADDNTFFYSVSPIAAQDGVIATIGKRDAVARISPDQGVVWSNEPDLRSMIGVTLSSYNNPPGSMVVTLLPGMPAEAAGIAVGDVIVEFNGEAVTGYMSLVSAISRIPPSTNVTVKVFRGGEYLTLRIKTTARTGENDMTDRVKGIFELDDETFVVLRTTVAGTGLYFEAFTKDKGVRKWRRDFPEAGYSSEIFRTGNLVGLFCASYMDGVPAKLLVVDITNGEFFSMNLSVGAYSGTVIGIFGGRVVISESTKSNSVYVFDCITGTRLLSATEASYNVIRGGGGRYFVMSGQNWFRVGDLLMAQITPTKTISSPVALYKDRFLTRQVGRIAQMTLRSLASPDTAIFSPPFPECAMMNSVYTYGSEAFVQNSESLFGASSGYFALLTKMDLTSGELKWQRATPYGSYLQSGDLRDGYFSASYFGQAGNFRGSIVYDATDGSMVFVRSGDDRMNFRAGVAGGYVILKDGGALTLYGPATPKAREALSAAANALGQAADPDTNEAARLCEDLLNARMFAECLLLCDALLSKGPGGAGEDRLAGYRGWAKEQLSLPRPLGNAVPSQGIKCDGNFDDWPDGEWADFGEHAAASAFGPWDFPSGAADLSARYRVSASPDAMYIAVEVRDDVLLPMELDVHENAPSDHIEIIACGGAFPGDYPSSFVSLTCGPSTRGKSISSQFFQGRIDPETAARIAGLQILAGFSRDAARGVSRYEVKIPSAYFTIGAGFGYFDPLSPSVLLNILVCDRDATTDNFKMKYLELAPTFNPHLYSHLRFSLFPKVSIPRLPEGWK
ncbi:MAG: PQQ-binding-like beta-propeller repeat protein [Candidatus Brocadiia bacterium]